MLKILTLTIILTSFGLKKKHVLTVLLSLELLCIVIIIYTLNLGLEIFFGLVMICIGACEGAVGLGCIIGLIRIKQVLIIE